VPVFVTLCLVDGGMYASILSMSGTSGCPSILATPLPCSITKASSFPEVECQPTLSPGLSFTEPPRIPLVCGAPLSTGQSPPAQSKAKAIGSRFACSCAAMTPNVRATQTSTSLMFVMAIRGNLSVSVGMVVRCQLLLKTAHFFLQLLDLLFEFFHTLFDFGMLVTVLFDRHETSSKSG